MKAWAWEELIGIVHSKSETGDERARRKIRRWLSGFPAAVRPTAALALSVAKWHPDATSRGEGAARTCGCCVLLCVRCEHCPLNGLFPDVQPWFTSCIHPNAEDQWLRGADSSGADETYNAILAKYAEAYAKLPKKWRAD